MNMTIMVCTKLNEKQIHTTYINLEGDDEPYIMGVTLSEPPWKPVGNPQIPEKAGETLVTVNNHETEQ
jgi:hypothetical protein